MQQMGRTYRDTSSSAKGLGMLTAAAAADAAAADADDERGAPPERLADFGQQCSVLLSLMS